MADKHESQCCVVCLEESPAYHFVPCKHKCVCENCAKEYIAKEGTIYTRCPVCRREFDSITSDITRSMMLDVGTEKADEKEEEELRIACALSRREFVNKIQNDMLQEQLDLRMAISASEAQASKPPTGAEIFSEDEMFQIACALSVSEAVSKQAPIETIDLTQDEIRRDASVSSVTQRDLKVSGVPEAPADPQPDVSNLRQIRLTFFAKVKLKLALFVRAFRKKKTELTDLSRNAQPTHHMH